MSPINPADLHTPYSEVKQAINGLRSLSKDDDDIAYIANKLNTVLQSVYENACSWNGELIYEFVLTQHDPLKNLSKIPEHLNHLVRQIQNDIVIKFS
jgi:hypothetical protein